MGAVHHPASFLHGNWSAVTSSNVDSAMYDPENELLFVRFKDGSTYQYLGIGLALAASFAEAPSAGAWIWDHVKVRGKGNRDRSQVTFIKM